MTLQEERLLFLHDTVYFYGSDVRRRAICVTQWPHTRYMTGDGRRCSIGRHIPLEKNPQNLMGSIKRLSYKKWDNKVDARNYLPEKIYLLGLNFLEAVSLLHDRDEYWFNHEFGGGLTWMGQRCYSNIIKNFCKSVLDYENYF